MFRHVTGISVQKNKAFMDVVNEDEWKQQAGSQYHKDLYAEEDKEKREKRSQQVQQGLRNWAERVGTREEGKTVPDLDELGRPKRGSEQTPKRVPPRRSAGRGPLEEMEKAALGGNVARNVDKPTGAKYSAASGKYGAAANIAANPVGTNSTLNTSQRISSPVAPAGADALTSASPITAPTWDASTAPSYSVGGRSYSFKEPNPGNYTGLSQRGGAFVSKAESPHLSEFTAFLHKEGAIGTVDGMGTVAVSSDPGVFSPTYGDRSPIKQKKKRSGVAKLDQFLRQKNKKVQKFATDVVQGALQDLREYDIMKIDDDKYGEDPRVVDKADGDSHPKLKPEPKQEKQPSEPKPAKVTSPRSIYKEEDNEEFFSLFKDYFEYLDKEQESTDDSRDVEERLDSEETGGSDLD